MEMIIQNTMNLISVTNILTQRRPSAEFVTSLVEAFSQRVSSSPLLSNRGSVRLICNSFIAKQTRQLHWRPRA